MTRQRPFRADRYRTDTNNAKLIHLLQGLDPPFAVPSLSEGTIHRQDGVNHAAT